MLEKTLESPLESKEIQQVHPKGNQSWVFIGKTDVEAETPVLWPPDAKSWFMRQDPDAGKDWGQEEKGTTEVEMVGWHHQLNGHEFEWTPGFGDGQGGLVSTGLQRVRHDWVTELNCTELKILIKIEWVNIYACILDIVQFNYTLELLSLLHDSVTGWDLGPAVLAPERISPRTTKYKETLRESK